jgi:selenocysteine lyase/cysteine desulfurase
VRTIYLDHGATAFPKAPEVAEAVALFLNQAAGNPGRGGHRLSVSASRVVEGAREDVASLLGGKTERTVFGPGATFWINAVLASRLSSGDRVVTTSLEHNSVMRPLRWYEKKRRIKVVTVNGRASNGVPTADEIVDSVTRAPTSLVVMNHASNVTGVVLPVAEVAQAVSPVPVLVDAAQTAGSLPIDFGEIGAAALAASGHKGLLGPPGIGVLLLAPWFDIEPLVRGGTGSRSESEEMPEHLPDRLEAGTVNSAGAAGLGAACAWIRERTVEKIHERVQLLLQRLASGLLAFVHHAGEGRRRAGVAARPQERHHGAGGAPLRARRPPAPRDLSQRHRPRRHRAVQHRVGHRCADRSRQRRVREWHRMISNFGFRISEFLPPSLFSEGRRGTYPKCWREQR